MPTTDTYPNCYCCEVVFPECPPTPRPGLIAEVSIDGCDPLDVPVPWSETDGWLGTPTFDCPCGYPPGEQWTLLLVCENPNNWNISLGAPTGTSDLTIVSVVVTPAISIVVTGTITCQSSEFDPPATYGISIIITEA